MGQKVDISQVRSGFSAKTRDEQLDQGRFPPLFYNLDPRTGRIVSEKIC